jgi:hypothetical protein
VSERPAAWTGERAFPRVQYPSHLRPYLLIGNDICEVVDCSERGLRYGSSMDPRPVGSLVNARICFRNGLELPVRGRVVRIQDGEIALALEPAHGIPGEVIATEEALLRQP